MASTLPSPNPCCTGCDSTTLEIVVTPPSSLNLGWFNPDTLAALRALPNRSTNVWAFVGGGLVFNDGLGGGYSWRNSATDPDDGALWIKPNDTALADPGRWMKEI